MDLIDASEVTITDMKGVEHKYLLSILPYKTGRKVAAVYPVSNMPKVGNYAASEEVMMEMFRFIAKVNENGDPIRLTTSALIDNHIPDTPTGLKLEAAMLAKNFDFFGQGGLSVFLKRFSETHLPSIIKTLTPLLPPSLVQDFAAGLNSKKSD